MINIIVSCKNCGKSLDSDLSGDEIVVVPCPSCLAEATTEGYDKGYDKGYETSVSDGESTQE